MTITDVSAAYKDTIRSFLESLEYLMRPYGRGTQSPDSSKIRGVLESADTSQVSTGVSAPITKKTDNFRFELTLGHIVSSM